MKEYYSKVFKTIFIILFFLLITRFFIISPGKIVGDSMEPTFNQNELVFINKITYLFKKPQRFDVVEITEPTTNKIMIKRIIGLPNEILIIKDGQIFIQKNSNSAPVLLTEPHLSQNIGVIETSGEVISTLGDDSYFVLGDKETTARIQGHTDRYIEKMSLAK